MRYAEKMPSHPLSKDPGCSMMPFPMFDKNAMAWSRRNIH